MNGEVISFRAEEHYFNDEDGVHLMWKNIKLLIKEDQQEKVEEIRKVIAEALHAKEKSFGYNSARSVVVEFYENVE